MATRYDNDVNDVTLPHVLNFSKPKAVR